MIPTVQQVLDQARREIGDDEVTGGQVFTDTGAGGTVNLREFLQTTYEDFFQRLSNIDAEAAEATRYFDIPAFQGYFDPKSAGINNVGEIESIRERVRESSSVILDATPDASTPQQYVDITFAAPHGRSDGDEILVYKALGISDDLNDSWTVTAPDPTTLRLLGSTASGTYTANSGVMSYSSQGWSEKLQSIDSGEPSGGEYRVIGERVRLHPVDYVRQVRFELTLSGQLPASDSSVIPIDGSLKYLALQTAGSALGPRNRALSRDLLEKADIALQGILRGKIRAMQKNSYQPQRWRDKRNAGTDQWTGWVGA